MNDAGWETIRLEDALDALIDYRGKTPKKTLSGIPLITAKIVKNGFIQEPTEFISENDYDAWMVRGFPKTGDNEYDVLFGKLRPYFHKVCIAPLAGISSTDILIIQPNKKDTFSFCLNHLYSNELITFVSAIADGTRMPRVDWKAISNYKIVIPPERLISQFQNITFKFYKKIIENNHQSTTLAKIRDALLPKLMNGEIPVGANLVFARPCAHPCARPDDGRSTEGRIQDSPLRTAASSWGAT